MSDFTWYIKISADEYRNLCGIRGRIEAAQALIDNSRYISVEDICHVIGLDCSEYEMKREG